MKANDNIQRNIEDHLKEAGIYYERRENYYKRQGLGGNKVIGLLKMAQITHTVVNKEALTAVNDTMTLFDTVTKYNSIFNDKADFDIYRFAAVLYQKIWTLKNSDLRTNSYTEEQREGISKGGFIFLHIMSSLLLSYAEFKDGQDTMAAKMTGTLNIEAPARRNEFTKRKKWLFESLETDTLIDGYYTAAKVIFETAADEFSKNTGKTKSSLFKNRTFDKEYLRPAIDKYIDDKAATGSI